VSANITVYVVEEYTFALERVERGTFVLHSDSTHEGRLIFITRIIPSQRQINYLQKFPFHRCQPIWLD